MAIIKKMISQLDPAAALTGSELIHVVQGGISRVASMSQIATIAKGDAGASGESAYQTAFRLNPAVGTEAAWSASLEGPEGPQGPAGIQGGTGPAGPQGLSGPAGSDGPIGPTGPEGPAGPAGPAGAASTVAGPQGPAGTTGPAGAEGPQGIQGLTGATGATGPAGPAGAQGPQGIQGVPGETGAGNFVAAGTGLESRTFQNKMRDQISIMDYHTAADGTNYSPTLVRALGISNNIFFPAGTYNFVTPVNWEDDLILTGVRRSGGSVITAPSGFMKTPVAVPDDPSDRRSIRIEGLDIRGDGSGVGLDGPFGGSIIDCWFSDFTDCIRNPSGFLSRYIRCQFDDCTNGILIADANDVRFEDCFFSASCITQINMMDITPLPPGLNKGAGIIMIGNNFNRGGVNSNTAGLKLQGQIFGMGNYFEDYSPAASSHRFMELTVGRFDDMGLTWINNEMNGQGDAECAIWINGSSSLDNPCKGEIARNRMFGFTAGEIVFGPNNRVSQLKIYDNGAINVVNWHDLARYRPIAEGGFDTSVNATGGTLIVLPIAQDQRFDNGDQFVSTNVVRTRNAGLYQVTGNVSPATRVAITVNGIVAAEAPGGIVQTIVNVALNDDIQLRASGGTVTHGSMMTTYLGTGNY